MASYYPVYLDLKNKKCVIVGGGAVAERKASALFPTGAKICLISPTYTPQLAQWSDEKKLNIINRKYQAGDLAGVFLVVCATDNEDVNRQVAADAERLGILVNIVDVPELCNFIVPSIVKRGDFIISISTGGNSPALAKKTRKDLEQKFGGEYGEYVELLGECRRLVLDRIPDIKKRSRIFQALVDSDLLFLIKQGNRNKLKQCIEKIIGFNVDIIF